MFSCWHSSSSGHRFDTHGIRAIPAWAVDDIFQGLKFLPLLGDIHISQPDFNLPFLSSIKHLNGLRTFHWGGSGHCHRTIEKGLSLAIAACPNLSYLELDGDSMSVNDASYISHTHSQNGYRLCRLFRYVSPDKPLPLTYLDIREWNVSHSVWLYPNLRSLQTLIMRDGCDVSPHFWNGLVKEHIRIPDLTLVVGTDPAPLHFLRSNKEMVRLVLCTGLKDFRGDYEQVERTGKAFFKDVLPLLSGTLEELHIKPRMRGKWGYGAHATDSIAQCKQLKVLGIHVSDHDSMVRVYFRFFHFNGNAYPLTVDIFIRLRQSVARFAYVVFVRSSHSRASLLPTSYRHRCFGAVSHRRHQRPGCGTQSRSNSSAWGGLQTRVDD